ncbi:MAG: acyl-CoA dehydrogenase family protein [Dehalococcoidia bacterium]|nr:acyl-CoA dehydrogenase family protein [Dehalococcoidia bacterium]
MQQVVERTDARLYHPLGIPKEMDEIRSLVRSFAEKEVAPVVPEMEERWEDVAHFPAHLFQRMAELGLYRLPFKAEEQGAGSVSPMLATAVVMEELAYFSNSIAVIYDCQCVLPGRVLQYASNELRSAYLPGLMSGEKVACVAITEPDAGSDVSPTSVQTVAVPTGEGWKLTGTKRFIINSPLADFSCVLCTIDGALSMVVVDMKQPGVRVPPPDRKLGMHACLTADIVFEGAFVPAQNLVWQIGKGLRISLGALTRGRIAVGASGVGMAQAALDLSIHHMKNRKMFGNTLAAMQHWQFKFAEHATHIGMARDLCYKAALRHDAGEEFPEPETAMCKYYGTQLAGDVARDAVQVMGGYGFVSRMGADGSVFQAERIFRESKGPEIYEGSNEIQKWMIARQMFGR